MSSSPTPGGVPAAVVPAPEEAPTTPRRTVISGEVVVGNDIAAVQTERVAPRVDLDAISISDAELLATLAQMGRRTGIARVGGRVFLTQPVTDEELNRARGAETR